MELVKRDEERDGGRERGSAEGWALRGEKEQSLQRGEKLLECALGSATSCLTPYFRLQDSPSGTAFPLPEARSPETSFLESYWQGTRQVLLRFCFAAANIFIPSSPLKDFLAGCTILG